MKAETSATLRLACLAALAFWGPDILVHAVRRNLFSGSDVLALTVAMPLALFLCWATAAKSLHITRGAAAIRMLFGIWLLGGLCMSIGATFSGGGFAGPDGLRGAVFVIAMSLLPVYTFAMATYDGSLGALLVVSLVLFLGWIVPLIVLKTRAKARG
jgi:hypothetical protein